MRRRLLPLFALRAFESAGRHESFQKAADELGVTTSAISRHIAELERIVGGKLFIRNVRKVELTDEGSRLRESLSQALDRISEALLDTKAQLRDHPVQAPSLKVHVLPTFATRILIPHLPTFESAHSGVMVALTVASAQGQVHRTGHDLRIDYSPTLPEDPRAVLFREDALPVCAPHYIGGKDLATALAPEDLLKGRLLSATDDSWDWKMWARHRNLRWPLTPRLMLFETDDLTIQAALAGTGIALVERRFILRELADQRLVPIGRNASAPLGYYFLRASAADPSGSVRAFSDWLRQIIATLDEDMLVAE